MWKVIAASASGTSHLQQGRGCDDACAAKVVRRDSQEFLIAACCDGAGSATHSSTGARLVADAFVALAEKFVVTGGDLSGAEQSLAVDWCRSIRQKLTDCALSQDIPVRELATTLLGAVIGESAALFMQLGDGAMVIRDEAGLRTVFWPQSGEYVNTTNFITQDGVESQVAFQNSPIHVSDFAAFTDGLERLALRFADRSVHTPFFESMLKPLMGARPETELQSLLEAYLDSPKVNERTDDDKTLILAVRIKETDAASTD